MEPPKTLLEARDQVLAQINDLLKKTGRSVQESKQLFVNLSLLFQLSKRLNCEIEPVIPRYCSTCTDRDRIPDPTLECFPLGCGGENCYYCSVNCFLNKYNPRWDNRDVFCQICGRAFTQQFMVDMQMQAGTIHEGY